MTTASCDFFTSFLILRIAANKDVHYKKAQRSSKSEACPQRSSEQSLLSGHCSVPGSIVHFYSHAVHTLL